MKHLVSLALVPALVFGGVAVGARTATAACSKLDCGSNSPIIDMFSFHELNEVGLPNDAGLRLRDLVTSANVHYHPDVIGGRLVGRDANQNIAIEHAALAGSYLEVFTAAGAFYKLYIDHVTLGVPFLVGPAASAGYESYELNYTGGSITQKTPVCSMPPRGATQQQKESVLYAGERFVALTKRVRTAAVDDNNWFNVGCYNHVLWKTFVTRHTIPSSALGYSVPTSAHQAILKMWVGDVCGNGNAFTTQGTPLYWNNPPFMWGSAVLGQDVLEGLWGPDGALCINEYRKGDNFWTTVVVPGCGSTALPPLCSVAYPNLSLQNFPAAAYVFSTIPQALP